MKSQVLIRNSLFLIICSSCLLVSCSGREVSPHYIPIDSSVLSGEGAFQEVDDFVALGPRVAGTPGAGKASGYLADKMKALGLSVTVDEFKEEVYKEDVTFRNVTARLKGQGDGIVVIASHFDTKAGISEKFVGANDSGSSTGLLLELAKVISEVPALPYDIIFAFLDGEECRRRYSNEDGLHGSRRLAGKLKREGDAAKVLAVVVLDMIGDRDLLVTLPRNCSPELLGMVFEVSKKQRVREMFSLAKGDMLDDHVPFIQAGMPAVDLIDFSYGSSKDLNDYWHTDEDTMDKISKDSLQTIGRIVIGLLNELMDL
jgi:glutaminyl-peptide cyclotransferase